MKMNFRVVMLSFLLLVGGSAIADEFEAGRVTGMDREKKTIEIDGESYHCTSRLMRGVRVGERVEFIAEYKRRDKDGLHIIEIRDL